MLEYALVHGNYYGTLKATVKEALDAGHGCAARHRRAGRDDHPQDRRRDGARIRWSMSSIMPPTLEELEKRLRKRGTETEEQVQLRLPTGREESKLWRLYKYTILSGSMEEDLTKFRAIMRAERYLSQRLELHAGK